MSIERRRSERLEIMVAALLRRHGREDARRTIPAVIANVSGGGAFVRVAESFAPGERLLMLFRLSRTARHGPRIAARAQVLRASEDDMGIHGMAVRFTSHRFL